MRAPRDPQGTILSRLGRRFRIADLTRAYQLWDRTEMLVDLCDYCRGNETTYDPDPRQHALLEGRRQVWLRIVQHAKLTEQQLMDIYDRTTGRTGGF